MAILLALLAALSYGVSDFLAGLASRRISAWTVAVVAALAAAATIAVAAPFFPDDPSAVDFAWGVAAGAGVGLGTAMLYRGLGRGRMSVVAPVSAVGAALVPVLFGVVGGERPGALAWLGLVVAAPAIWLVASGEDPGGEARPSGFGDGVLAGLGFGLLFACIGQVPRSSGMLPLAVAELVSVPTVIVLATFAGARWLPRSGTAVARSVVPGITGGAGNVLFLVATHHGFLSISSVLTALYPATTVVLALVVLHERLHRAQLVGLLLCAATVALVAAG